MDSMAGPWCLVASAVHVRLTTAILAAASCLLTLKIALALASVEAPIMLQQP